MQALRSNYQLIRAKTGDRRAPERIVAHYELERELANRLRHSTKSERKELYGQLYSELFTKLPDHPQHTALRDIGSSRISAQLRLIGRHLRPEANFVEIGCGDAALSIAVAKIARSSVGIDITDALIPKQKPENFSFVMTDGTSLDLQTASVDLVYSNQLMEHLHPDDAKGQLMEIRRILKPGGKYICVTPNRVSGPHDVSQYFGVVATGFHLREYDYCSLRRLFTDAGFRRYHAIHTVKNHQVRIPYPMLRAVEVMLSQCPEGIRFRAAHSRVRWLLGMTVMGVA